MLEIMDKITFNELQNGNISVLNGKQKAGEIVNKNGRFRFEFRSRGSKRVHAGEWFTTLSGCKNSLNDDE